MQAAGAAGRFANFPLLEDFGLSSRNDGDNWQPRAGFAYDLLGNGRDVDPRRVGPLHRLRLHQLERALPRDRRRWRTRSGVLREQSCRHPQGGRVLLHGGRSDLVDRLAERGRSDARAGLRPGCVAAARTAVHTADQPRVVAPGRLGDGVYRRTTCASTAATSTSASVRIRASTAAPRRLADLPIRPNTLSFRTAVSKGESTYDGLIIGLRRRMSKGFDLSASYTLSDARSIIGTANDELDANNIQDATDPFAAGERRALDRAPTRATACRSAPWFRRPGASRSRRSSSTGPGCRPSRSRGSTLNNDGNVNDITPRAYKLSRA